VHDAAGSFVGTSQRFYLFKMRLPSNLYSIWKRGIATSVSVCRHVCASVYPRAYLRNYPTDLHQLFVYVTYGRGSVARAGGKLRVSGFVDDVIFGATSIPLQRLTSLRRRAQANAPAVSYWMRRVLDDGRRLD